jgi:7-cyano-7-deazaguanine synthase
MKKRNVIVLSSGGIDSTACIHFYLKRKYEVTSLFVDYGQLSKNKEAKSSLNIAKYFNIPYRKIKIKNYKSFSQGYIQGRNALLLTIALINSEFETGIIAIAIHSGTEYSDCSQYFVDHIQLLFDDYSKGTIKIGVPFINFYKYEIWKYCKKNNIPLNLTYSCELGLKQPCNKCSSCKDFLKLYENFS